MAFSKNCETREKFDNLVKNKRHALDVNMALVLIRTLYKDKVITSDEMANIERAAAEKISMKNREKNIER